MRAAVLAGVEIAREVVANPTQAPGVQQLAERVVREGESIVATLDQIVGRTT